MKKFIIVPSLFLIVFSLKANPCPELVGTYTCGPSTYNNKERILTIDQFMVEDELRYTIKTGGMKGELEVNAAGKKQVIDLSDLDLLGLQEVSIKTVCIDQGLRSNIYSDIGNGTVSTIKTSKGLEIKAKFIVFLQSLTDSVECTKN